MADRTVEESGTMSAGNKEIAPDAESTPAHASDDPAPAVGFFERLRHHKVAQWTLAYAAGAYTLLHAVEMVSGALGWPHLVVSLTTLVLLLGFPVVITLAWFHGHRARQRVSGAELAILTLLLALGGGLLWLYGQRDTPVAATSASPAAAPAAQGSSAASADERPSVAVLPFENRSRLEDDVFFVDGIHDDILTQLSKVSALKVISRTSVEKFRDTPLSTQEIAGQLGVTSILEGGVQRVGDRVRIHVQLIDAGTDAHLWAESYDRELSAENIFAIQTEVAVAIAGALKTTLTAGERTRMEAVPTQNLQAWENYQLGRQRFAKRTGAGFTEAERYFQKAVELDPNFALAYCGLADSLAVSLDYTDAPRAATLARAQAAVDTALKLDPELADAWVSAGQIESYRDHRDRAEAMFRRAVELDPNHAMAHKGYGLALRNLGRFVEGVAQLEQAARLDPLSAIVRKNLGQALEAQGRFRDAASQYRKAIEIDPLMPGPYQEWALLAASAMNHYAAAVPLMARAVALDPDNPYTKVQLAALYWDLGDDAAFDLALREAEQRWPDKSMVQNYLALRDLQLQDLDGAARHAQRALDLGPDNRLALLILGWIDVRLGRYPAAAERYRKASPELFSTSAPRIDLSNWWWAYEVVPILQKLGEDDRADAILKGTEDVLRKLPRLVYAPTDAVVLALRGRKREALEALRSDQQAGWREDWRFYRDIEPSFDSIRDDPEFKAIFVDIERDMARQRAELAKQPEDAPLDLEPSR